MPGWYYIGVNAALQHRRLLCEPTPTPTTSTRPVAADRTGRRGYLNPRGSAANSSSPGTARERHHSQRRQRTGWRLSAGSRDRRSCTPRPRHPHRDAARAADHHQQTGAPVAGVGKNGKGARTAQLVEFAREGVETFTRAQKKFLDVVAQETAKATRGKPEHNGKTAKKTELTQLARDAGNAFVEAQKRLLDLVSQQMNVNLDVATRTIEMMSPSRLSADGEPHQRRSEELCRQGNGSDRVARQAGQEGRKPCETGSAPCDSSAKGSSRFNRALLLLHRTSARCVQRLRAALAFNDRAGVHAVAARSCRPGFQKAVQHRLLPLHPQAAGVEQCAALQRKPVPRPQRRAERGAIRQPMARDPTRNGKAHPRIGPDNVAEYPFQREHHLRQHDERSRKPDALHRDPFQQAHGVGRAGQIRCRYRAQEFGRRLANHRASRRVHSDGLST